MDETMAQKMPSASSTSPMLTTSRRYGTGNGTTSPKMPPPRTKSATVAVLIRKWNGSRPRSAGVKPAACSAPVQTGIWPPLKMMASVLRPMPTAATCRPGTRQFPQSQTKISR